MKKPTKKFQTVLFGTILVLVIIFMNSGIFGIGGEKAKIEEDSGQYVELEQALMKIEGVGEVALYVHYNRGEEKNPLSDYFSLSKTQEENGTDHDVDGVLVVAEGADSWGIKSELSRIISTVLQLPEYRIVIVEMKKRGNTDENK